MADIKNINTIKFGTPCCIVLDTETREVYPYSLSHISEEDCINSFLSHNEIESMTDILMRFTKGKLCVIQVILTPVNT